jgi:hypothetical protein
VVIVRYLVSHTGDILMHLLGFLETPSPRQNWSLRIQNSALVGDLTMSFDIRLEIRRGVGFLVLLGLGGGPTSEKAKSISNSIGGWPGLGDPFSVPWPGRLSTPLPQR